MMETNKSHLFAICSRNLTLTNPCLPCLLLLKGNLIAAKPDSAATDNNWKEFVLNLHHLGHVKAGSETRADPIHSSISIMVVVLSSAFVLCCLFGFVFVVFVIVFVVAIPCVCVYVIVV